MQNTELPTMRGLASGGGVVLRRIRTSDGDILPGSAISEEQLSAIPRRNRQSLVDKRYIQLFLRPVDGTVNAETPVYERCVVSRGNGKFDVIRGVIINDEHLTKREAEILAGEEDQ